MRSSLASSFFLLLLLTAVRQPARADSDAESRARMHYVAGKTLYGLGNYSDALRELLVGYALVPKPQFLINIGQCYRRLDDLGKAKEMYKKFLVDTPPGDHDRAQVEELLREIERQLHARAAVKPQATLVLTATPPEPPRSKVRTWYWAVPVAVVAAAGISVGLYFALKPTCSASYGCISAGGGN